MTLEPEEDCGAEKGRRQMKYWRQERAWSKEPLRDSGSGSGDRNTEGPCQRVLLYPSHPEVTGRSMWLLNTDQLGLFPTQFPSLG